MSRRWYGAFDFACHTASCRPPGSGGTGGSDSVSASTFARDAVAQSKIFGSNAWMNSDGSITPVDHHSDGGGYTQATLKNKVRIIAETRRGELTVDSTLMNKPLSQQQVDAVRVMFAQTKAKTLYVDGPWSFGTKKLEIHTREIDGILKELNDAISG